MTPIGYTKCLYYFVENSDIRLFLSANDKEASKSRPGARPLDLNIVIPLHGHNKIHDILKKFGERWVAREGRVYYPE